MPSRWIQGASSRCGGKLESRGTTSADHRAQLRGAPWLHRGPPPYLDPDCGARSPRGARPLQVAGGSRDPIVTRELAHAAQVQERRASRGPRDDDLPRAQHVARGVLSESSSIAGGPMRQTPLLTCLLMLAMNGCGSNRPGSVADGSAQDLGWSSSVTGTCSASSSERQLGVGPGSWVSRPAGQDHPIDASAVERATADSHQSAIAGSGNLLVVAITSSPS